MGYHRNLTNLNLHAPTNFDVTNDTVTVIPALTAVKTVDIDGDVLSVQPITAFTDKVVGITRTAIAPDGGTGVMSNVGIVTGVDTSAWTPTSQLFADDDGTLTLADTGLFIATVLTQDVKEGALFVQLGLKGDTGLPGDAAVTGVVLSSPGGSSAHGTIASAVAAAVSGDCIILGPGTYAESFTLPFGVSLIGQSGSDVTLIAGSSPTGNKITLAGNNQVKEVAVTVPTDATYAFNITGPAPVSIIGARTIGIGGAGRGYGMHGPTYAVILDTEHLGDCGGVFHATSGTLGTLNGICATGVMDNVFMVETGAYMLANAFTISPNTSPTDVVEVAAATIDLNNCNIQGGTNGVHITSDSAVAQLRNVFISGIPTHVLVDPGLTDGLFRVYGGQIAQTLIDAPLAWWASADVGYFFMDETVNTNDKTLRVLDEFVVGHPYKPGKVNLGGGDNYSIGMCVFTNTNLEVGTWADQTPAAYSISGSTFSGFPGTSTANSLYIGGEVRFRGLKLTTTVPINLGAGAITWEYWDGSTWVSVPVMCSEILPPLTQYANDIFGRAQAEHVHLGDVTGWTAKSLNGELKYWLRARVTTGITDVPTVEEVKLLPNRVKFGLAGEQSMFGEARVKRNLPWSLNLLADIVGASPANENIAVSAGINLALADNEFVNSTVDSRGAVLTIPFGLDTSIPLELELLWIPLSTGAGNVELEAEYAFFEPGSTLNGSLPAVITAQVNTGPFVAQVVQRTILRVPVASLIPGDRVALRIFRDATGGNPQDTFGANIALVSTALTGTFWR